MGTFTHTTALPDLHRARLGPDGFRNPEEFRNDGKHGLGGLEELHAGAVPDRSRVLPDTRQGTPSYLTAEPYHLSRSTKLHVADSPRRKRHAVFDEEAIRTDIQDLQERLSEETDVQGLLWLDALRAPAFAMWSRIGRAGPEPPDLKTSRWRWGARSLRKLGCASSGGCRTLASLLEFVHAAPRAVGGPLGSPPDRIPTKPTNPVAHTSSEIPQPLDRPRISGGRAGPGPLDLR